LQGNPCSIGQGRTTRFCHASKCFKRFAERQPPTSARPSARGSWRRKNRITIRNHQEHPKNVGFSLRNGQSNTEGGRDVDQSRFFVNDTRSLL
jgi:hypothetical protein